MIISFIKDWPEIQKSEIPPSEFCPISGDWENLEIPNLAQTSLIKCFQTLQNARVTAFTVSELLRENQQGGVKLLSTTQIRVNNDFEISSKIFSDKNCRQSKLFLMKNFTCLVYFSKWNENWKADNLLEMTFQQFKWSRISEY